MNAQEYNYNTWCIPPKERIYARHMLSGMLGFKYSRNRDSVFYKEILFFTKCNVDNNILVHFIKHSMFTIRLRAIKISYGYSIRNNHFKRFIDFHMKNNVCQILAGSNQQV